MESTVVTSVPENCQMIGGLWIVLPFPFTNLLTQSHLDTRVNWLRFMKTNIILIKFGFLRLYRRISTLNTVQSGTSKFAKNLFLSICFYFFFYTENCACVWFSWINNSDKMSSRKRSGSGSKRPKEKVVFIYEMIFRPDFEDPSNANVEFWQEFFLLQPNIESLEYEITKLSCEQLIALKTNFNLLFCHCIEMLDSGYYFVLIFIFSSLFHAKYSEIYSIQAKIPSYFV